MTDSDDELVDAVRELARTIDDLRRELESEPRRSPARVFAPRPPTPRNVLRFADEVALPAMIAVLKTSVRTLEGFQRALRLARTEREVRDRTTEVTSDVSERASDLRRTTLSRLDTILTELQRAAAEGTLPADERARDLLTEARELRDDVDERLRDVGRDVERRSADSADGIRIDIEDGGLDDPSTDADEPTSSVDVDAELETLKDQYGVDEDENDDADGDETSNGRSEGEGNGDEDDAGDGDGNSTADGA